MKLDRKLFRIGIPLIDKQHERYLDLVVELFEIRERDVIDQAAVDDCIEKVLAYALEHFDAEEALMRSVQYPEYEAHRIKHDEFRNGTDRLASMGSDGMTPADQITQLTKWLVDWFRAQTLVHDKKLAAFISVEIG